MSGCMSSVHGSCDPRRHGPAITAACPLSPVRSRRHTEKQSGRRHQLILFEIGQPTHVFDLDKLDGGQIIVRMQTRRTLSSDRGDAVEIELDGSELVIADANKPVALAGVKGSALTAVTDETKNILVEAATFDPVAVRHTSRRHNISSDSSFRFERWFHLRPWPMHPID